LAWLEDSFRDGVKQFRKDGESVLDEEIAGWIAELLTMNPNIKGLILLHCQISQKSL
jgi:hypothetical protein